MNQRSIALYLAVLALVIGGLASCSSPNPAEEEKHAAASATEWLGLLDAGKFEDAWKLSDDAIKGAGSKEQFAAAMTRSRSDLGKEISRTMQDKAYAKDPQNAPPGEYVQIHFHSSFQNAQSVTELVTLKKQTDGAWKVGQYAPTPE